MTLHVVLIRVRVPFDKQTLRWNDRVLIDPMYNKRTMRARKYFSRFACRSLVDFGIINGSTCLLHVTVSE